MLMRQQKKNVFYIPLREDKGDIAVVVNGSQFDDELVHLACFRAKRAGKSVHLMYVIAVPRSLPLTAILQREADTASKLLHEALAIANAAGCNASAAVVQTREVGPAIVDEAKEHDCALIMLGHVRTRLQGYPGDQNEMISYVLAHAPCKVWLLQDMAC